MELGTQVPRRSFTKCRALLGSVCLIVGLGTVLWFAGIFDWNDGIRLTTAPLAVVQVPNASNIKQHTLFCVDYEVCKCQSNSYNERSTCAPDTCRFAPAAPYQCCEGFFCIEPHCEKTITTWEDCEWANFPDQATAERAGGYYPGEGLFSDVPKAHPKPAQFAHGLVVFSDVDDTIKCSGGIGGVDTTCLGTARGEAYPGVAEFMLGLSRGPYDVRTPPKVIPLSARPDELRAFLAMKKDTEVGQAFANAGRAAGIPGWGLDVDNAQYGSIYDIAADFFPGPWGDTDLTAYNAFGYRKYSNWQKIRLSLGRTTAFVGDNGQGDVVAAQMMLKRSAALSDDEGALRMAFIHDAAEKCTTSACFYEWWKLGIVMFSDYGYAAQLAKYLGLMSAASCHTVCVAVKQKRSSQCTC